MPLAQLYWPLVHQSGGCMKERDNIQGNVACYVLVRIHGAGGVLKI
jgi:hypothetical protein